MASLQRRGELGYLFDRMTLGVVKALENKPGVCDVRFHDKNPAEKSAIYFWEQKNMCELSKDLKNFYMTTDGISIQWSIEFDGGTLPIGNMEINSLSSLTPVKQTMAISRDTPSLMDIDDLSDGEDSQGNVKPHFDERNKCFELDSCLGFGKVCLVYKDISCESPTSYKAWKNSVYFVTDGVSNSSPEIWLLDRSLRWTYLTSSFECYFRMLIVHLGLPLWQYRFTEAGMSPETKQWFNLYAPNRGDKDVNKNGEVNVNGTQEAEHVNQFDAAKVFNRKSDTMKTQIKQGKKKQASNARTTAYTSKFQGNSAPKSFHR